MVDGLKVTLAPRSQCYGCAFARVHAALIVRFVHKLRSTPIGLAGLLNADVR